MRPKNEHIDEDLRTSFTGLAFEGLLSEEELVRRYMLKVLAHCGGNRSAACRLLGVDRTTFYRRLKRWNLDQVRDGEVGLIVDGRVVETYRSAATTAALYLSEPPLTTEQVRELLAEGREGRREIDGRLGAMERIDPRDAEAKAR